MNREELKNKIGSQALDIIVHDLGLTEKHGRYSCPATDHNKDDHVCQWYNETFGFFCHDCKKPYDIWNHADSQLDPYQYLCDLANVEYKPKMFQTIDPVTKTTSQNGYSYMAGRGISKDTLDLYRVRADDSWIYFNYATPDEQLVKTKWRAINSKDWRSTLEGSEILYGMHLLRMQTTLMICEGEIDALSMYEIVKLMGATKSVLCSSLPNGASSLVGNCLKNCKEWMSRFDEIILIPDRDDAGDNFIKRAEQALSDYNLHVIELPVNDVNEYLMCADYNPAEISKYKKAIIPELTSCHHANSIEKYHARNGHPSGFVTVDYNMNGLQDGWVTLATGITGHGKTTFTRQILLTYAINGLKSFMFVGESSSEKENTLLARLCCDLDCVEKTEGTGGGVRYNVNNKAYSEYKEKYGGMIILSDPQKAKEASDLYAHMLSEMIKMTKHGVKLYVLDNLMKLCVGCPAGDLLSKQKQIISDLKDFALKYSVHVILIAHLRKDNERISGASEVENTADAVLRYERIFGDAIPLFIKAMDLDEQILNRVSAYIVQQKVRDEGTYNITLLEWESERGAVINLSTLPKAIEYQSKGYWTRAISRVSDEDVPNYDKQAGEKQ